MQASPGRGAGGLQAGVRALRADRPQGIRETGCCGGSAPRESHHHAQRPRTCVPTAHVDAAMEHGGWAACGHRICAPNPTSCSEPVLPTTSCAHTRTHNHPQTLAETAAHAVSSLSFNKQTTTTKQRLFLKNLHLLREMLATVITVSHSPVRFLVYPSFPLPWTMGRHTATHLPRSAAWVCSAPRRPHSPACASEPNQGLERGEGPRAGGGHTATSSPEGYVYRTQALRIHDRLYNPELFSEHTSSTPL